MPGRTAQKITGRLASRLKFPQLFLLTAVLFVLDLVFPDMVPFVDEVLLGLLTLLFGLWKERRNVGGREGEGPGMKDVTPPSGAGRSSPRS